MSEAPGFPFSYYSMQLMGFSTPSPGISPASLPAQRLASLA